MSKNNARLKFFVCSSNGNLMEKLYNSQKNFSFSSKKIYKILKDK